MKAVSPFSDRRHALRRGLWQLESRCRRELGSIGRNIPRAYYLFQAYDEVPENWPEDPSNPHVDPMENFCEPCALQRIEQMRAVGIPIAERESYADSNGAYEGPWQDWGESHDCVSICPDCGTVLETTMTEYCIREECGAYEESRCYNSSDLACAALLAVALPILRVAPAPS